MIDESISQLGLAFFGLTSKTVPQYRAGVFKQIHEIVFHGNGGYDWYTVYNMPLWLRKFTFNEIKTYHEKQNDMVKNQGKDPNQKNLINPDGTVNTPEFLNASKDYKGKTSYK